MKRSGSNDQVQPRLKKKVSSQEEPWGANLKIEKGGGSQNGKPTCDTCGIGTMKNAYWVQGVVLDVVNIDTKRGIVLVEIVSKLLLIF